MIKTALITGASAGIGEAFAKELASRQTNLILIARSQDKLEKLARQLREQFGIDVEVIVRDLTVPGATQAIKDEVSEKGWVVDLLINNAGFGDYGSFAQRQLQRQVEMIQLNILASVELTYLFLADMQQRNGGAIINISSIAAFQPLPYLSVYSATKAFVLSFTQALWAENKDNNVKILAVCPGPTESQFFEVAEFPESFDQKNPDKITPASQVVKEALDALAKDASTVVTGGMANNIIVNLPRFFPRDWLVSTVEKQFRA